MRPLTSIKAAGGAAMSNICFLFPVWGNKNTNLARELVSLNVVQFLQCITFYVCENKWPVNSAAAVCVTFTEANMCSGYLGGCRSGEPRVPEGETDPFGL